VDDPFHPYLSEGFMSQLLQSLLGALDERAIQQMAGQLGASPQQTHSAVQAALPMVLGMLGRNASNPQGAQALAGALSRNHNGDILSNVLGALGNQQTQSMGGAILGHVLGARQGAATQGLSNASGLNSGQAGQVLAMLAPIVMGALGKQASTQQFNAGGLGSILQGAIGAMGAAPGAAPAARSPMAGLLDTDGDGDVDFMDIAKHGMSIFGALRK
jgi:hypothetical protein